MVRSILQQRWRDVDEEERREEDTDGTSESGGEEWGSLMLVPGLEDLFVNYARSVENEEIRRIWHMSDWSNQVRMSVFRETLWERLSVDPVAQEKLDGILEGLEKSKQKEESEDEGEEGDEEEEGEDVERYVTIPQVNALFPKTERPIRLGDWILYMTYQEDWSNILR